MLNRLSDFYRIVNPNPSDALITQRREAISAFLEQLQQPEIQCACADIAAFGFGAPITSPQATAAKLLIDSIQEKQPSFSSDIATNALDIRVCAGVALGEYLKNYSDSKKENENSAESTAALIISALATRTPPQELHLANFVSALLGIARGLLQAAGNAQRERPELRLTTPAITDIPSIKKALDSFKDAVDRNLRADREELEILWWVFGGHSITMSKPFQVLELPQRILAAGSELAELALLPPIQGLAQFLLAILKEDRPLTLRQLIEPCDADLLRTVARRSTKIDETLKMHPTLLPLTWLCNRRVESNIAPGWEAEFEQKTQVSRDDERPASIWTVQVFNECVAAKLLARQAAPEE